MLYAGLDLSRKRLDFHLLDEAGETVEVGAAPPDADGLRGLAARLARHRQPLRAAIESMTGARFVHDQLELRGLGGRDRRRAEGEGTGAACLQDRPDRRLGAGRALPARSGAGDLAARPAVRAERERARFRLHLVRHRSSLKQRVHATLLTHGKPCPVSDLFGVAAASCSPGSSCPSHGRATSRPACV